MQLNIKQRFSVVAIYIGLILGIGYYFSNDWQFLVDTNNNLNAVLIATGLALILSIYITEPYFSKPVDVITRWVAIFLFLIGLNSKQCLSLAPYWFIACAVFTGLSLLLIFLHGFQRIEKQQRIAVDFICKISRPEIVFTLLYFDIVVSFFRYNQKEYPILIGFGFLLAINKPIVWLVNFISAQLKNITSTTDAPKFIGQVIGHESTDLYKVELQTDNPFRQKELKGSLVYLENITNGVVGIVLSERILLGKKWLEILSLRDKNQNLISFNIKTLMPLTGEKSIFSKTNAVYLLNIDVLEEVVRDAINTNKVKANFKNLIGNVWEGSTINKIKFNKLFSDELQKKRGIGEGSIIQTEIANEEVLYQIIDARTDEESLEFKDTHGFTIGTAQKLGKYISASNELNTVKWLPEIYTPIFLLDPSNIPYNSNQFIGKLPNTNYGIPIKNYHELVTHNTAILGILGIGKSCLTFELLQKLLTETDVKIICIDITNEYYKDDKLPIYIDSSLITHDVEGMFSEQINARYEHIEERNNKQYPNESGNKKLYQNAIATDLHNFLFNDTAIPVNFTFSTEKRVRIYNPDYHKASQGEKIGFNVVTAPLTQTEKTRIISEEIFKILMKLPIDSSGKAKVLLVFEEAHSLIPEWNSVANEGDKNATNGTAKVILQGRKYGLGSLVITQRSANISKSILNQCNTIFAMRVFDDTGKQFLENYIGSDYSNLLPTLEERHCIAIGKALKLKQPVILELNDMNEIILPPVVVP
jgi:hypothetical protein